MIDMDFSKHRIEDLIDLNSRIVDYVKAQRDLKRTMAMHEFGPGDRVQFKNLDGVVESGIVMKVNRKTIIVHSTDSHVDYRTTPGLLTLLEKFNPMSGKYAQTPFSP